MRLLLFLLFCFLNLTMIAQKQDIEIEEERSASQIKLLAVNNTSEDLELTFNLDIVGFMTTEKLPVVVILKPGIRQFLVTLTAPKGVQCQYESSISYKKIRKEIFDKYTIEFLKEDVNFKGVAIKVSLLVIRKNKTNNNF